MSNPFSAPRLELDLQRESTLLDLAEKLLSHQEPGGLFAALAPCLLSVVHFDFLNFAVADVAAGTLKLYLWDGGAWPAEPKQVQVDKSAAGWVWQNQTPLIINDIQQEERFHLGLAWLRDFQLASYCLLPVSTPFCRIGALGLGSRKRDAFTNEHVHNLSRAAEIVAICVDKSTAIASGQDLLGRLQRLLGEACGPTPETSPSVSLQGSADDSLPPAGMRKSGDPDQFVWPQDFLEQESHLAAYLGVSRVGLGVLDADLRYLGINSSLAEMNGVPARDHLGKTVRETLGDFAAPIEAQLLTVLATNQPVLNYEVSALRGDHDEIGHWVTHFFPILDESGRTTRIAAVAIETTRQKKLESSFLELTSSLKREKDSLQVLLETSRLLAANWDVAEIFPKISAVLRRILHHEGAFLSVYDEASKVFTRKGLDFPLNQGHFPGSASPAPSQTMALAMARRRPLLFSREELAAMQHDGASEAFLGSLLLEGVKSFCCAPLVRPHGPIGTLSLLSTRPNAFQPDDLDLINQVAAQLAIALENSRVAAEVRELKDRLAEERRYLAGEIDTALNFEEIIGESLSLRKILEQVATVAPSDATVLVLGETGTGKELIARAIHRLSSRSNRNFIKLNCAAIPTGLLESELFGHEKGAFTGAILQRIGRMELADKGTLFLDEIGEIPLELQPKLLRVLQDQEFERLGSTHTIKVNVRLIAATNRDLARRVAENQFRSDLFYRLNVFPVVVPPLRERTSDIPILVRYFVRKFSRRMDRHIESIPSETMNALTHWHWPGNVRELENFIERSVILSEGSALRAPLAELVQSKGPAFSGHTLENAERDHIVRVLRDSHGVIGGPQGAARRLGVKRTTLQSKMQKLGITRRDYMADKSA